MFGKREQIVALSIGVLATIGLVHLMVFEPRARVYGDIYQRFTEGTQALQGARMPAGTQVIPNFQRVTTEIKEQVTSVVAELNLDTPDVYKEISIENLLARFQRINGLVEELVSLRESVRTPTLSFLDNRPRQINRMLIQDGWNFPRELPRAVAGAALVDTLRKAIDRFKILKTIPDPLRQLQSRREINQLMDQLGASPMELSTYLVQVPQLGVVFFSNQELANRLGATGALGGAMGGGGFAAGGTTLRAEPNPMSIDRFGPMVPILKKIWIQELIRRRIQPQDNISMDDVTELLEIPFEGLLGEELLTVERQLAALIDIVRKAERNRITEISQVNLMKPMDFGASRKRGQEVAATPAPEANANMGMGMMEDPAMGFLGNMRMGGFMGGPAAGPAGGLSVTPVPVEQRVAAGTGIELFFRANNSSMVDFLFEIGSAPRTYAIDDLHIRALPNNEIQTSATIELVTKLLAKN
jgi:hypothetical protein